MYVDKKMCRFHGGRYSENIKIDFSTPINPIGPPKFLEDLIREAVKKRLYMLYPDYEYKTLREAFSEFYNLNPEHIVLINGAAEGINLILTCLRTRDLIVFEPTFGEYRCLTDILDINLRSIPYLEREDFYYIDEDSFKRSIRDVDKEGIVLFSNPNNPTGAYVDKDLVANIINSSKNMTVIIDEAFIDLCEKCSSVLELVKEFDNLVVLRSLTKTFSVPGLRIGFIYTENKKILEKIDLCRQPWNINSITSYVFSHVLKEYKKDLYEYISSSRKIIEIEREFLYNSFRDLGIKVYRSYAPFLLLRHFKYKAEDVIKILNNHGIHVRDASKYPFLTPYHIRVSVRLREDNEYLVKVYKESGIR
jgi:histidinol-phosphate aminotransferase